MDVLIDDLGYRMFDLVLLNNLAHHFTAEDKNEIGEKSGSCFEAWRNVKPRGEFIRSARPGEGGVAASSAGLYFSLTIKPAHGRLRHQRWQRQAELKALKPIKLQRVPGWQMLIAKK